MNLSSAPSPHVGSSPEWQFLLPRAAEHSGVGSGVEGRLLASISASACPPVPRLKPDLWEEQVVRMKEWNAVPAGGPGHRLLDLAAAYPRAEIHIFSGLRVHPEMRFLETRALEAGPFGNSESGSVCVHVHVCVHVREGFYAS